MTAETETFTAGRGVTKISPPIFLAFCRLLAVTFSCSCCDEMYAGAGASLLLAALLLLVVRMPTGALELAPTSDCSGLL